MSTVLQADEKGNLLVPPALLPESEPGATYTAENNAGKLIIAKEQPREKTPAQLSQLPQERSEAFRQWIATFPAGPGLSDYAVSRDSIYD